MFVGEIDRFAYTTMLYDFYGSLLTAKQSGIIEMHIMNDLSLSEIGAELGISRQAAGILLSRTEKILNNYENRLGLVEKHISFMKKAEHAVSELREIRDSAVICNEAKEKIDRIISDILEEFPRGF